MPIYGAIYVIHPRVANGNTKIYVGSTDEGINVRKSKHKYCCNTPDNERYNYPVYKYIRENGGWCAFETSVIEGREYEDLDELRFCEQYHLNRVPIEMRLNTKKAYLTRAEHLAYERTLYTKRRELLNNNPELKEAERVRNYERYKKWIEHNREQQIESHRVWRDNNREKVNKQARERVANNREKFNKQQRESRAKRYEDENYRNATNKQRRERRAKKRAEALI
jgi:hypothetical protein